jgi:hypothetical protein
MTKITRKVHAVVICPRYTVATDGSDARKKVVAMEGGLRDMAHERTLEQALTVLWHEVAQAHFLHGQTTAQALVALEKQRKLVLCLLEQENAQPQAGNGAVPLMMDRFSTLLKSQLAWLEHARIILQTGADNQNQK